MSQNSTRNEITLEGRSETTSQDAKFTDVKHVEHGYGEEFVDLDRNIEGRIKNPLAGVPYDQLMQDVERFAREKNLEEYIPLLRKGALVAQDPDNFENISGSEALTEQEKAALRNEVAHKWSMPWKLFLTIFTCSIGAAVQGWDQTGINGASIFYPKEYGIDGKSARDTWLTGLVSAGPYIGSAFLGCWLADPLNNYLGRRGVIFIAAHFCCWPIIGSAFCKNWYTQFIARLIMGVGMGVKGSTVPIYAAENAPAIIRGALVMSWQMWTAFGIFLGTAINLAVFHVPKINWRLMLGAPFIPAIPLMVLIYLCPESPRWYMKKNRYSEAWKSMLVLRNDPIQVARDIYYIHSQLDIEFAIVGDGTYFKRLVELFTVPRIRRASLAAFTVMIAQQMCGINIIAFYSTEVFVKSGFTPFRATICSFGFGLVNWLFAFPAFWTIDTFGRRSLLLFTFPNMMWTLLCAALCNLIDDSHSQARLGLVALFVFLFAAFYSPGEGPVPFTYSAEVFPLSHREVGMGFAVAVCLGFSGVLTVSFPFILDRLGTVGAFGLYAGFNGVALIMIFFWVPETKQRTLEELDYVFAVPTSTFARYQLTKWLPWFFRKWVLFQRNAKLEPLYHFDRLEHHGSEETADVVEVREKDSKATSG